jgi:ABC-2 family transporter protein
MSTQTVAPYQSAQRPGRDGFAQLLRAELTKLGTVRGWAITLLAAAVLTALATVALASAGNGTNNPGAHPSVATGPGGHAVTDQFYFVHQPLDGTGSLTVRMTSLTGKLAGPRQALPPFVNPGIQAWAKAGIIIKASTKSGSAYAAVLATGTHGIRMQYDYTHDIAGPAVLPSATTPAWLRLTRSGDTITAYESADGTRWTRIGTAHLAGLPATVQAGLFATSPDLIAAVQGFASNNGGAYSSVATGTFDHVGHTGNWPAGAWTASQVGLAGAQSEAVSGCGPGCQRKMPHPVLHDYHSAGGIVQVTGSGDIAPYVPITDPLGLSFKGSLVGIIAIIALATLFITAEYRRGMMVRTTLAASPRRGRVLVAKAVVIGVTTFVAGLVAAAAVLGFTEHKLASTGWETSVYRVWPLLSAHGVQIVVGTAALFGLTAVLAVAVGAVLRRSAGAIAAVIGVVVVPLVLGTLLPNTPARWLLEITPAAAFSAQQGTQYYPQVAHTCLPYNGCYPLSPGPGIAVLAVWAAAALAGAIYVLRRRDV